MFTSNERLWLRIRCSIIKVISVDCEDQTSLQTSHSLAQSGYVYNINITFSSISQSIFIYHSYINLKPTDHDCQAFANSQYVFQILSKLIEIVKADDNLFSSVRVNE